MPGQSKTSKNKKPRIQILIPCTRSIEYEGFMSVNNLTMSLLDNGYGVELTTTVGLPHAIARNQLFQESIRLIEERRGTDKKIDYILWIDSDHRFMPEDIYTLIQHLKDHDLDSLSATYFTKSLPTGACALEIKDRLADGRPNKYKLLVDFTTGRLYEMDAVGFGMFLMKPEILEEVYAKFGKCPFTFETRGPNNDHIIGEDISFCEKMKDIGYEVWLDTGVLIGHMGPINMTLEMAQMLSRYYEKIQEERKKILKDGELKSKGKQE